MSMTFSEFKWQCKELSGDADTLDDAQFVNAVKCLNISYMNIEGSELEVHQASIALRLTLSQVNAVARCKAVSETAYTEVACNCPECAGTAITQFSRTALLGLQGWTTDCTSCIYGPRITRFTKEDSISSWNRSVEECLAKKTELVESGTG